MKKVAKTILYFVVLVPVLIIAGCSSPPEPLAGAGVPQVEAMIPLAHETRARKELINIVDRQVDTLMPDTKKGFNGAVIFRYPISSEFFAMHFLAEEFQYHFYLIITDKLKHKASVEAAVKAYMCNFSDKTSSNLAKLEENELLPFIAPINNNSIVKTSEDLYKHYNTSLARTIHKHLGEDHQQETVMIIGTTEPIRKDNLSKLESDVTVLGLSQLSANEISNKVAKLNNAALDAQSIADLIGGLSANEEKYLARAMKAWFRTIGQIALSSNQAVAQPQC